MKEAWHNLMPQQTSRCANFRMCHFIKSIACNNFIIKKEKETFSEVALGIIGSKQNDEFFDQLVVVVQQKRLVLLRPRARALLPKHKTCAIHNKE